MISPKKIVLAFRIQADTLEEKSLSIKKENALPFLKKLYPKEFIFVEAMPDGLAYFKGKLGDREMIGNYSFIKKELWYKIPK